MTFEIDVNGRTRAVASEKTSEGHYRVLLDGQPRVIDAARVGVYGLSLLIDGDDRTSHDVQVTPGTAAGELLITFGGRTLTATVNARRTGRAGVDTGGAAPGEQSGRGPRPGRVVRVLVARAADAGL